MEAEVTRRILKRELFVSFCIYYFPLMILMSIVVLNVDYLKQNIGIVYPILCLLFPAVVSVVMAFVRVKVVWDVKHIPDLKNVAAFASIMFFMFLVEKIVYSTLQQIDLPGLVFFSVASVASLLWFKLLKGEVDRLALSKMLILASTLFIFIWLVFAAIVRTLYGFIVLTSWILLFFVSLYVLKKEEEGR